MIYPHQTLPEPFTTQTVSTIHLNALATLWRGLAGCLARTSYRGVTTHTANGLTVDWSIRTSDVQS